MTFLEFLPFLGLFLGMFVYFAAKDENRSFAQSAIMALGAAIALASFAAAAAYFCDSTPSIDQACIRIPEISIR